MWNVERSVPAAPCLSLFNRAFRFPISQAAKPFGSLISRKSCTLLCLTETRRTIARSVVNSQFEDGVKPYIQDNRLSKDYYSFNKNMLCQIIFFYKNNSNKSYSLSVCKMHSFSQPFVKINAKMQQVMHK